MATPNLQLHQGETFVIKIGGEASGDPGVVDALIGDILILRGAGIQVILLHGGGPQATALAERLDIPRRMVGGRRITDPATLEVMKMTLAGQVRVDLLARCRALGVPAVGVDGIAGDVIQATKRPPRIVSGGGDDPIDFGEVGDIEKIGGALLTHLLNGGYLPVVNSLGADENGRVLNINADIAATRMAIALGASRLFLLTGAPGVLRDPEDPTSTLPSLSISEAQSAIAKGVIRGGMIPKLEESFVALRAGVEAIHIFAAQAPSALLQALSAEGAGTILRS